ncbi:regulator of chromosome condensation family protein [Striga asiatica]|uniref:Regulator of chromosome condensation family protein n=1 Tax=Striga asiatica TaxID=4170 RepID=A0A5A7PMQ3_STRAF|nr:regulator of chromosome condensation family protein [Striga asiatica]
MCRHSFWRALHVGRRHTQFRAPRLRDGPRPEEGFEPARGSVAWHTALITSDGRLFTFGEGSFGILGHGNRESVLGPKEVESISGLAVACGVWHTAAIVEVTHSSTSGKLFTWGDGDKNRLGQGDKEARLEPTCAPTLVDHNFRKVACGYGFDYVGPCFLDLRPARESRVGRETTLPRHFRRNSRGNRMWGLPCGGSNVQKRDLHLGQRCQWELGSLGPSCRQAFRFMRKRRSCYNCGLPHCHACSSRKVGRAALAEGGAHADMRFARLALLPANSDLMRGLDAKASRQGRKGENSVLDVRRTIPRPILSHSSGISRAVSPFSRKLSPPRSATPVPAPSGLSFSQNAVDSLRKTNELLNQELHKLRLEVESLRNQYELQELELQKSTKKAEESVALAREESAKCDAAEEVIRSLTIQSPLVLTLLEINRLSFNIIPGNLFLLTDLASSNGNLDEFQSLDDATNNIKGSLDSDLGPATSFNGRTNEITTNGACPDVENSTLRSSNSAVESDSNQIEAEWIEQYEPGVYITLVALQGGMKDLKRVRFR